MATKSKIAKKVSKTISKSKSTNKKPIKKSPTKKVAKKEAQHIVDRLIDTSIKHTTEGCHHDSAYSLLSAGTVLLADLNSDLNTLEDMFQSCRKLFSDLTACDNCKTDDKVLNQPSASDHNHNFKLN